uniref:Uncharacterized protein n=1 Tax=Rhizophora mucronata TaxID=61149 RepID=A0A2P2NUG8_RHIMU
MHLCCAQLLELGEEIELFSFMEGLNTNKVTYKELYRITRTNTLA